MKMADSYIENNYQTSTVPYGITTRRIFKCPDIEWQIWFKAWVKDEITWEPFPDNHVIWGK